MTVSPAAQKFNIDTVEHAAATPDTELPWAELGLKEDEFRRVVEILGRRPTAAELAMYSVMWSEHCSYKSSKVHLKQFGDKVTEKMKEHLLVGIGENAGVVDIGEGWAVTFKVESHNHPSFVEPYQGAATGVGGIVRDIISMGARPVAVMDPLRFGAIDHPDTARLVHGIVSGIGGGKFAPKDPVTREQFAAIIYRYAAWLGYDTSKRADLSGFTDERNVSSWAVENVQWAVAEGLISGKQNHGELTIDPKGETTRAEGCVILTKADALLS